MAFRPSSSLGRLIAPRVRGVWNTTRIASLLLAAFAPLAALQAQSNYATPYTFSTIAGTPETPGSIDGTGAAARFRYPGGVAVDGAGNVYVADSSNNTIRKVTPAGVVTTLAGLAGNIGSSDGTGSAARFYRPNGVAVDGSGNVYVADTYNLTIRKITSAGVVTTLAGTAGVGGYDDGTGSAARFGRVQGLALDGAGNLYAADTTSCTIRKITSGGVVTTVAGYAGTFGSLDGYGGLFNNPYAVAIDGSGNIYVADSFNNAIRKVTFTEGYPPDVSTLAGVAGGPPGSADGTGSAAQFNGLLGIAVDGSGTVYVSDLNNHTIRAITPAGVVTTLAGTTQAFGPNDGTGIGAQFYRPVGLAVDGAGNLYVGDSYNQAIRKIAPGGVVTTLAGTPPYGLTDGTGSAARFNVPYSAALDAAGNLYIADTFNHAIRKMTPTGVVTTLAGTPGVQGSADGVGSAARFTNPQGVGVDGSGNVYVADTGNDTVRKITPDGTVTTLAGHVGSQGTIDGTGDAARFSLLFSVAADGAGNVYVGDGVNIRKITSLGVVTTFATGFNSPRGLAVDGSGNIYIGDFGSNTIKRITPAAVVSTFAGTVGSSGSTDGTGSAARFFNPAGVSVDGSGNVYVADFGNNTVRKITAAGVVTTLGGLVGISGSTDGAGSAAQFFRPEGVAVNAAGNILYIADTNNSTIRKGVPGAIHDFNGDGKADIIWENTVTGVKGFWLMNGTALTGWAGLSIVPPEWRIAAVGDVNGDGKPDIVLEDTVTGLRGIWLMNGTSISSFVGLGVVSTDWRIAAVGDFNGDGKPDIVWENTVTGLRGIWLMNGTALTGWAGLSVVPPEWRIAAVGDFNGDGKPDIVWENTVTGLRGFWLMNGTSLIGWVGLGTLTTDWRIAP